MESERQLLFEAMAYLNDDVRSPVPDIEKIQSDIKRLKDFIAYKVTHSDEERDQFRPGGSASQTPRNKNPNHPEYDTNIDDNLPLLLHDRTYYDENGENRETSAAMLKELEELRAQNSQLKEENEGLR